MTDVEFSKFKYLVDLKVLQSLTIYNAYLIKQNVYIVLDPNVNIYASVSEQI